MEFKAEVKELLDLMIHSLYSHKEIFLRELISNSSDAIDRLRIESLTNDSLKDISANWKIKIISDKTNGTLTVSDNGIGMSREEIIESLGTIAHSGTKEFISAIKSKEAQNNPELIGQFGVGFYSSFMVSDKVTVLSRRAGEPSDKAVKWESSADGSYSLDDAVKDTTGTDIILKIKEEEKKYLEEWEIKSVVKKYSDFIEHPVVIDVETEKESSVDKTKKVKTIEEETINSRKAIWLKRSSEVTQDEYNEFYQHISHDYMNKEPFKTIHFKAEGTQEFSALLYIPKTLPFNIFYRDYKFGPKLYVKRVQITEHCEELIWPYLRFIQGVVDSSDLPLNVDRKSVV